jgi:biotin carboxylase
MFSDSDITSEGFVPLKRAPTEPKVLAGNPERQRTMSFNATTGEKADEQTIWDNSSWSKMERSHGKTMGRSNSFVLTSGTRARDNSIGGAPSTPAQAPQQAPRSPTRSRGFSNANIQPRSDGSGGHPYYGRSLAAIPADPAGRPNMIAVVDPFSTGAHLAREVTLAGIKCARVFSIWDSPVAALIQQGLEVEYAATVQHNDSMADQDEAVRLTAAGLRALPFNIIAVIAGAETGVLLADTLSAYMGLRSNGVEGSLARRNKWHMGEAVRAAGHRAVKQRSCKSLADLHEFISTLTLKPFKCVVKPVQSAGTDDVFLCSSIEEAETAFKRIYGKRNGLGLINESALAQEFLVGTEYVVDKVSLDGVHKTVAIWEYDKRFCNDAAFVYFGMSLRPSDTEKARRLMEYADNVLTALGIMQGPSHMEVMWCADGPCLVEVGSRCQGGEGSWLPVAKECIGYTQVEVTIDMYLGGHGLFHEVPKDNYPMHKFGRDIDLVNYRGGIVRSLKGETKIRAYESFRSISWETKPGDYMPITIDCFTRPGCAQLVHEREEQVDADVAALHELFKIGLLDYTIICPRPPSIGAVVVVDAFSTGANMAAMLSEWGYRLVLVFSEKESPVKSMISKGTTTEPTLVVQHDNSLANQEEALQATLKEIKNCGSPVLAILPGAETGVELADRLATKYKTRTNGVANLRLRRDKFLMHEEVRKAGLRHAKQALCHNEEDVRLFFSSLPEPKACVVKPNESAGSDLVTKCKTLEEALAAFASIHGKVNSLGQVNRGALMQEFLSGTEYVIDGVSRDGEYKCTAIWRYDKRTVNGENFVYYGMFLCDGHGRKEAAMIEYAMKVNASLGILQGPSHMEVMWCADGPCLVEVGARCHGGEGSWLPVAKECIGYTQVDVTLNCYLRPDLFDALPSVPTLVKRGAEVFLVALESVVGREGSHVKSIPGVDEIAEFQSFRRMELLTQPGKLLLPTKDTFSCPGTVQFVNEVPAKLLSDYERVRELEEFGLFSFE